MELKLKGVEGGKRETNRRGKSVKVLNKNNFIVCPCSLMVRKPALKT